MKLINTLAALALLASPLAIAEVNPNIKAMPETITKICSHHPSPKDCYGYVVSTVRMSTVAGQIDGMCKVLGSGGDAKNRKNCSESKSNVEFIQEMNDESK